MPAPHHLVSSLSISGATRFADGTYPFADGLNTLCGGFGTGKTAVLHIIRWALGAHVPDEDRATHLSCVEATLGPGLATVEVVTQRGVKYTALRKVGEEPRVFDASGKLVQVSLDGALFKIDAYALSEIKAIAMSTRRQVALLDKFAPAEIESCNEAIADAEARLALNASEIASLETILAENEAREAELPSVEEALKGITFEAANDAGDVARVQERKVTRARERRAVEDVGKELAEARAALEAFAQEWLRRLGATANASLEQGPCAGPLTRIGAAVHDAASAIESGAGALGARIAAASEVVTAEGRVVAEVHAKEEAEYHALVVRQDADRERAAERERLHRRHDELSAVGRRMGAHRAELAAKLAERRRLLDLRSDKLRERTLVRNRVGDEITATLRGVVKVSVTANADRGAYVDLLTLLLRGTKLHKDYIAAIAHALRPEALVAAIRRGDIGAITSVDELGGNKEARADKIVSSLRYHADLGALEIAPIGDVPLFALQTDTGYEPSATASDGQKCVCILSVLLIESASPLSIDQVEDNLENAYIYDVLVKTLLRAKIDRQFIFVTHNPCIPVLGDAERVLFTRTKDGLLCLGSYGNVDETRVGLERTLDGGPEAFRKRGERYGHFPRSGAEGTSP